MAATSRYGGCADVDDCAVDVGGKGHCWRALKFCQVLEVNHPSFCPFGPWAGSPDLIAGASAVSTAHKAGVSCGPEAGAFALHVSYRFLTAAVRQLTHR